MATLSGILEVDTEKYEMMLRDAVRNGRNLLVFGPAGCGKTEIAISVINSTEVVGIKGDAKVFYKERYLNLSVCTPPELVGLPMIVDGVSQYALPHYMPTKKNSEYPAVMLTDELDKADTDLQNPMLEMFQFHSLNGTELNIQSVIATANLPEEGAFSKPISSALANRCQVIKLRPNSDQWVKWAASNGVNALITGYLSKNPVEINKRHYPDDNTAYCQPSPRSWTKAAQSLDTLGRIDGEDKIAYGTDLVASWVGQPAAIGFRVFLEHANVIEPIVDNIVNTGKPGAKIDTAMLMVACLLSVSRLSGHCNNYRSDCKNKDHQAKAAKMAINIYSWMLNDNLPKEIVLSAVRSAMAPQDYIDYDLIRLKEVQAIYNMMKTSK